MIVHDPRLTPARPDLAAAHLCGTVEATRFVEGKRRQVSAPMLDLKRQPHPEAGLDTQLLHGEMLSLYDEDEGWAWVQAEQDGYVGYVATHGLADTIVEPTHRVVVNRTFVYPAPDMKRPVTAALPLGARVAVHEKAESFARLEGGGYIVSTHLVETDCVAEQDCVAVAERLIGTPYLWGGRTPQGIDCSGLVQISYAMAGYTLPRDAHMQESAPALRTIDGCDELRRGDLVFWAGHVGIMSDPESLVHANGHHMLVCKEPLNVARIRIAQSASKSKVTFTRRQL